MIIVIFLLYQHGQIQQITLTLPQTTKILFYAMLHGLTTLFVLVFSLQLSAFALKQTCQTTTVIGKYSLLVSVTLSSLHSQLMLHHLSSVKVVNQPSPSLNADHRPDPILLYGPEKDIQTTLEPSSLHTEQHFSELPPRAPNVNRHSLRTSRNTPQSSIDLSDMISHRQSSISDVDDDMPGLVFNIPASSRSTSIDSLSSYSQISSYTSDTSISTEDQKAPKAKRRISTAPTLDTKQDISHEEDFHLPPLARKLSQSVSRRYLPQNQAILQTDVQGKIIAFNETAVSLFGAKTTLLKMHALDLLEKTFRSKYFSNLLDKFAHTRLERDSSNSVATEKPSTTILLCGKVV